MAINSIDNGSNSPDSDDQSNAGEDIDLFMNNFRVSYSNYSNINPQPNKFKSYPAYIGDQLGKNDHEIISSLAELATKEVARHIPFGVVEHFEPPVPEPMQCRIAFWSFPQDEEDIKLYACLANGNPDVFSRATQIISSDCVCDMLQVGFHLSANVKPLSPCNEEDYFRVAMTFDRCKITSCSCSCPSTTFWCEHTVAVCLKRIQWPDEVSVRAPVSESLQRLEKNQLQKFAQYLINELPQQILPAAQKLLDELLSGNEACINQNPAAPDPTAGATVNEETRWCLDDSNLRSNLNKILNRHCTIQTTVICDVHTLDTSPPPSVSEYSELLRAIRGREPEAIWNLIGIVSGLMKRHDSNFRVLLDILTEEILSCEKIVSWWFETKVALHSISTIHPTYKANNNILATSQYSSSNICDAIVHLWRLASMNPDRSNSDIQEMYSKFFDWHLKILNKNHELLNDSYLMKTKQTKRNLMDLFPGFRPALEGCLIKWDNWDKKKNTIIVTDQISPQTNSKSKNSKSKKKKHKARKAALLLQKQIEEDQQNPVKVQDDQFQSTSSNPEPGPSSCEVINHYNTIDISKDSQDIETLSSQMSQVELNISLENSIPINEAERDHEEDEEGSILEVNRSGNPPNSENEKTDMQRSRRNSSSSTNRGAHFAHAIPGLARIDRDLQVFILDHQPPEKEVLDFNDNSESPEDFIKVNIIKLNDPLETTYAKCESLYSHGYIKEARLLAIKVANDILNYPKYPNIKQLCILPRRRKKRGSLDNRLSIVTSEALSKIIFLCSVLSNCPEQHNLMFRLGLFGMEIRRSPAATKFLEVRLIIQKQELMSMMKTIELHEEELKILRERADSLIEGTYIKNSDGLTTLTLAQYILEALVLSKPQVKSDVGANDNIEQVEPSRSNNGQQNMHNQPEIVNQYRQNPMNNQPQPDQSSHQAATISMIVDGRLISDYQLGFDATLKALSVKSDFIDTDHPILCQAIRRQRCDLALALLTEFKDDQNKLDLILDNLLDSGELLSVRPSASSIDAPGNNSNSDNTKSFVTTSHGPTMNGPKTASKKSSLAMDSTKALSHVMFELAQTIFDRAGGNSMTTYFFRPIVNRTIHPGLQLCSLRIALYSVGLTNKTNPTWIHRTYNRLSSFIHEQALDIGLPAIKILSDKWEGCLTPLETALLADKAGRSDNEEIRAHAAELAKSCIRYSNILATHAVQRILDQCKQQNVEMLEDACRQVEEVADHVTVCPSILFTVARAWHGLYMTLLRSEGYCDNANCSYARIEPYHNMQQNVGVANWLESSSPMNHSCKHAHEPPHWENEDCCISDYLGSPKHIEYVEAAYRVGMKALNMQRSNNHSTKNGQIKEDDIILMLALSKLLGKEHLLEFSRVVIKYITNPNILYTIVNDLFKFFQNLPYDHPDRVMMLIPMVDRCIERFIKKVEELVRHNSEEPKNYIDTIIEGTKYLSLQIYTLSAFNWFEQLLHAVKIRRVPKYRTIDVAHHFSWLNEMRQLMENCHCRECTFGREVRVPTCMRQLENNDTQGPSGIVCPSFLERSRYLDFHRPYNLLSWK